MGPNYTFIDCQHSNREGGVQGIMFLMRRGSLQALGRLRGITAAAPGSAEGFAHLLGMSDGGNPELPRHQVQWALGEGRRPANIDQQLQQHAPMGGWTSWLVHEATSSQRHHPSLTAAAARFSSTSPSRTMHSSSSSSSKAGSQVNRLYSNQGDTVSSASYGCIRIVFAQCFWGVLACLACSVPRQSTGRLAS